jgi:hypothetical protein
MYISGPGSGADQIVIARASMTSGVCGYFYSLSENDYMGGFLKKLYERLDEKMRAVPVIQK